MSFARDPVGWLEETPSRANRPFLRTPQGRDLNYAALCEQSGRIASALMHRGVLPGERVAVQVDKSPEAVLLYVACLRMGAVFVPINIANTPNEVEYFLRDSRPRLAVIRPQDVSAMEPLLRERGISLETLGVNGHGSLLNSATESARGFELPTRFDPSSIAAIIYTSGTTGRSKGAMLTRANLVSNAAVLAEAWRFTSSDVLLHTLPLFHIHGLFAAINTVLASGSSLLFLSKFDAAETLQHLREATVYMGVPTHSPACCSRMHSVKKPPRRCACSFRDLRHCCLRLTESFCSARVT
jgi:malonyl-CoA/methylmalonyl-CoA synthetase